MASQSKPRIYVLFVGEKNRYGAIKKIERRNEADRVAVDLAANSLLVDPIAIH